MFPFKDNIPRERRAFVTTALVAINLLAYVVAIWHAGGPPLSELWNGPSPSVVVRFGAIPYEITHPGSHCGLAHTAVMHAANAVRCSGHAARGGLRPSTWVTPFSSMFLHGGLLAIVGNMLFLAIFGPGVEHAMGSLRFAAFYLLGGLLALACQIVLDPDSTLPLLGAGGAITAVLGAYVLLYPRARVLTVVVVPLFFTLLEVPALLLVGLWFVEQVLLYALGLTSSLGGAEVPVGAYVGGFLFGLAVALALVRRGAGRASLSPA